LTKDGDVLGTFALYSSEPRIRTDTEIELIEGAGHIALIAIERQRSQAASGAGTRKDQDRKADFKTTYQSPGHLPL
jgi:GAF domain-containing protein